MPLSSLNFRERGLLGAFVALGVVALFSPVAWAPEGDPVANGRAWLGWSNALSILSQLIFAILGVVGLRTLHWVERADENLQPGSRCGRRRPCSADASALDCAWMFFAGLIFTAGGSVLYHSQPDDLRWAVDRAGMAVAVAGMIGFAVSDRVSARGGWHAAWYALLTGLCAVLCFQWTGNILPWTIVQLGGIGLLLILWLLRPVEEASGFKWGWVVCFFALATLFELADAQIQEATHTLVSGQALKHLTVALAGLPLLHAVRAFGQPVLRHNPGATRLTV